jgi:hypothetical protein
MRAPIALEARPSRIWRGAVLALVGAMVAAVAAWCATVGDAVPLLVQGAVVTAAAVAAVAALQLAMAPPAALRWTGAVWELLPAAGGEPVRGTASVAVDLGGWMLLRFSADGSGRASWLPVERRGDEAGWHALRSALYSAPGSRR